MFREAVLPIHLTFLIGCQTTSTNTMKPELAQFNTLLEMDRQFIEEHRETLLAEFSRLNKYFGISAPHPVSVEIFPIEKNPEFKNCARIYGPNRIYIHSPASIATDSLASALNPYCRSKTYSDLTFTIIHEYIHSRVLVLLGKNHLPTWIWEGISVALSGELNATKFHTETVNVLSKFDKLNLCNHDEMNRYPYQLGGAALFYLEASKPGFIKNMITSIRNEQRISIVQLLIQNGFGCEIPSQTIFERGLD
jgi:hypothetical protein